MKQVAANLIKSKKETFNLFSAIFPRLRQFFEKSFLSSSRRHIMNCVFHKNFNFISVKSIIFR